MLLPLAPVDYYFARPEIVGMQFMFCFEDHLDPQRLRAALRDVLPFFPPLTSRLVRPEDTMLALHALDGDPLAAISFRTTTLERDPDWRDPPAVEALFDPVVTDEGEQLLKVTLHRAAAGSYLAVSMAHVVGDARSLFQFLRAWACVLHGETFVPPTHNREVLSEHLPRDAGPLTWERIFRDTGYLERRPFDRAPDARTKLTLHLSRGELDALKREAGADRTGVRLNDVVTAYLARRFHPCTLAPEERTVYVRCPVDYREHHPGLAPSFFGSAVLDAVAVFDRDSLPDTPLEAIASGVRAAIAAIDAEAVVRSLGCYDQLRRERGLQGFKALVDRGFAVANMSRLNREPLDFDGVRVARMVFCSVTNRTANVISAGDGLEVQFAHSPRGLGPECEALR